MAIGRFKCKGGILHPVHPMEGLEEGGVYNVSLAKDRSPESHKQFFAVLADAFHQMPEAKQQWRDPEHLRKWLLCKVSWCNQTDTVLSSNDDAMKYATMIKSLDPYSVVYVNDNVVRYWEPKSMKMARANNGGMSKQDFQRVKQDSFDFLDDYLGLERGTLAKEGGKAA